MAKGFKHGAGGGSIGINFEVVCNPQPETAKENTIWVDTDKINNYYFSATQPENMMEYDVWFLVGTLSNVAFSATKKNPVMIYPITAKQYVNGELVDKDSKSYQGGEWVNLWNGVLYENGDEATDITGGYTPAAIGYSSGVPNAGKPIINRSGNEMVITLSKFEEGGVVHTNKKIDLSTFKKLSYDGLLKPADNGAELCYLGIWSSMGPYQANNRVAWVGGNSIDEIKSIDVSALKGEYYIGFFIFRNTSSIRMRRLWLEG